MYPCDPLQHPEQAKAPMHHYFIVVKFFWFVRKKPVKSDMGGRGSHGYNYDPGDPDQGSGDTKTTSKSSHFYDRKPGAARDIQFIRINGSQWSIVPARPPPAPVKLTTKDL